MEGLPRRARAAQIPPAVCGTRALYSPVRRRPNPVTLLRRYAAVWREERRFCRYVAATVIDDVGFAATSFAILMLKTELFTTQHQRAQLRIPTLACFLIGSVVAGPIADWARGGTRAALLHWRWRVVLGGRLVETAALAMVIPVVGSGAPTVARLLPYFLIAALAKAALRPTRAAFEVDLLRREEVQIDADGAVLFDDRGVQRTLKVHLVPATSLLSSLRGAAALTGMLIGGQVIALAGGSFAPIFAFDVLTNLAFVVMVYLWCAPARWAREPRAPVAPVGSGAVGSLAGTAPPYAVAVPGTGASEAMREGEPVAEARARRATTFRGAGASGIDGTFVPAGAGVRLRDSAAGYAEVMRFLRDPSNRALACFLSAGWFSELVTEAYDGAMIVRHVLHGSADKVRHGQVAWTFVGVLVAGIAPSSLRRVDRIGLIVVLCMLADGAIITALGRLLVAGRPEAIPPAAALLAIDHGLSLTTAIAVGVVLSSASGSALRGRMFGAYAAISLVSAMFVEWLASRAAAIVGIPRMLTILGLVQVAGVCAVALSAGWSLNRFGLRSIAPTAPSGRRHGTNPPGAGATLASPANSAGDP